MNYSNGKEENKWNDVLLRKTILSAFFFPLKGGRRGRKWRNFDCDLMNIQFHPHQQ